MYVSGLTSYSLVYGDDAECLEDAGVDSLDLALCSKLALQLQTGLDDLHWVCHRHRSARGKCSRRESAERRQ